MTDPTSFKQMAADRAVGFIESGMVVGLGHGSTALLAVRALADRLNRGELHSILAIPCSPEIELEALTLGIPLTELDKNQTIDLTVDGADEVDPELNLIKGGGGALLREKIVAQVSRREIIMVDESKLSPKLGTKWALPVEVVPYGWTTQATFITSLGATVELRFHEGRPVLTPNGNVLLNCDFGPIHDPDTLAMTLKQRTGIVEHGLFVGIATDVVVAGAAGVRILTR